MVHDSGIHRREKGCSGLLAINFSLREAHPEQPSSLHIAQVWERLAIFVINQGEDLNHGMHGNLAYRELTEESCLIALRDLALPSSLDNAGVD